MRKLWIRWLALAVFVAVLAAVFVRLGEWQIHRLEQRRETNARVVAHQQQPVKPWDEVFTGPISDDQQWQRVSVTGTFDPDHMLTVRYRNVADQAGVEVVTPLVTSDGQVVLVNRGFLPRPKNTLDAVSPTPPAGEVTVVGYVRRNEVGKANAITPVQNTVRLINSPAIAAWLGKPVVDGHIQAISTTPADDPSFQLVPPPSLDEGPHLSYAVQWFVFTLIAVGGAVILIRGDLRERRKKLAREARAAAADQVPSDDAPVTVTPTRED
ncbi:SURF1 family cytochrome oxidase biogenesis protein [Aestuariimicrobium ganziense]|uniref:SURF1 family cytochrome oxidase biogenesis protein n=1 Tax=Aestuariimicrobium ganziense TaxID=2773677 RepID=UPI0019419E7C|nr:SURF1 family protein [Aestuariimicrobium ganziense]